MVQEAPNLLVCYSRQRQTVAYSDNDFLKVKLIVNVICIKN
jgi:hypothetical protein